MTAGWVAATTRGRTLATHLLGADGARDLAAMPSWPDARAALADTIYGADLPADADRRTARRIAAEATTWQLRILAGWLPPGQTTVARLAVAPLEIADIEGHLAALEGSDPEPPVPLGSLGVAWPRIATATSATQVRHVLARSVWGDPGRDDRTTVGFALRLAWARRVARNLPEVSPWAHGSAAVLTARELYAFGRSTDDHTARTVDRLLGARWRHATSLPEFTDRLPEPAAWPLVGLTDPADLWRAELAVLHRVATEAGRLAAGGRHDRATTAATMALFLVDLWRVRAAIEVAGRRPTPTEVFDAVA